MKHISNRWLFKIRTDIHQMASVGQLIDYIPNDFLVRIAYYAVQIWLLSPVIVMFSNLFLPGFSVAQQEYRLAMMAGLWVIFLQFSGTLGLLSGLISGIKNLRRASVNETKRWTVVNNHLVTILLILFLIWSLLSAFASPNWNIAFYGTIYRREGWFSYLFYAGIFCCGYQVRKTIYIQRLIATLSGTSSLLSLLSLFHMSWMTIRLGIEPATSVFHNSNHYAYFLCIAIFVSLTGFLQIKHLNLTGLLFLLSFTLNSATLILNKSFGPYLATIFGLVIMLFLVAMYKNDMIRKVIIAIIVFAILSLALNQISQHLIQDIWLMLTGIGQIASGDELAGSAGSGRWRLWVGAFQFIQERPLWGFGPDNLGESYLNLGINIDRPHNEILQFAASLGIPAAFLYCMAVFMHLRDWFLQRKKTTVLSIGLICLLLAYWFSSLFGNTMYYTTPFFALFWGLSAGQMIGQSNDRQD